MINFPGECEKLVSRGELSSEFYNKLLHLFQTVVFKISKECAEREDVFREFLHDFYPSLKEICRKIVLGEIESPQAYLIQSISNFLKKCLKYCSERSVTLSLNKPINVSEEEETEWIDIIPAESDDPFFEVLVDEVYRLFLAHCEKRKTDMKRYVCFLISKDFYGEELCADPSWSEANRYKIRERTRKFLKEFMESFSIEEKVMGRVLSKFLSEVCQKMNLI
ncbi:hypothetical protein [Pseudothermotoga sp.]|uniref:hypothetical protein n=1 Tax=Pseudothermotoga sp. TaxID=2033661 RepID=UPI0031F6635F